MKNSDQITEQQQHQFSEQASDWLVRIEAKDVSTADYEDFKHWLAADPAHLEAFRRIEAVADTIAQTDALGAVSVEEAFRSLEQELTPQQAKTAWWQTLKTQWENTLQSFRWQYASAFAASCCLVLAVVIGLQQPDRPTAQIETQQYATVKGEVRDITLADGSVISLGPVSHLNVAYSDTDRRVILVKGEAFFNVAKVPERPFEVSAGAIQVRVLGTQFNVHRDRDASQVAVAEGRVNVTQHEKVKHGVDTVASKQVVLTQGQAVSGYRDGRLSAVTNIDPNKAGAWRKGRLVFDDVPLKQVVKEINRYYDGHIVIASSEIAAMRVTIAFNTDQIKSTIHNLTLMLPIKAQEQGKDIVLMDNRP